MTPAQLLAALHARGCALTANGNRLRVHPRSAITPELDAALKRRKPVILAVIQAATPDARPPGVVPSLTGDDHQEAEALILFALGLRESARCHRELITDPERRRILQDYHDEVAIGPVTPAVAGEG